MRKTNQKGQLLILAMIVLTLVLINSLLMISKALTFSQSSKYSVDEMQAINIAEAGMDKAVASFNASAGTYNGETETALGNGTFSVTVTAKDSNTSAIKSTAYVPNKAKAKVKRETSIEISKGEGLSFVYGLQVGEGGISLGGGARINGSVYSNGNITTGNGARVTGDVYVAGGVQPTADQQSDCQGVNCTDYVFGKNVSGENRQDVAMSFRPANTTVINKVSLKLKKTGNPSNPTVRIMGDIGGKPNKNAVLVSTTLSSSLVGTSYGFADVIFSTTPTLTANTTYWIMIHSNSLDNSNYWYWSNDSVSGYNGGVPKWSSNWQAGTPVWTSIAGDLSFKTFMGGVATSFAMGGGSRVDGNVHVNTITGGNGVVINGDAYYQNLGSTITVNGTSYPNSIDPVPTVFPVSSANIADWKAEAEAAGVSNGNIVGNNGCNLNLGPGKIVGNVTLGGGCTVTVKSPLWITGTFNSGNGLTIRLDSSAGSSSGIILIDGTVRFGGGGDLLGSGSVGSYLMMLTTYDSKTNGVAAIDTGNGSVTGILYAPDGIVSLGGGANFKEVTAWKVSMGNGAILNYESGISSLFFSSGPGGSFSVIKGTYQSK